MVLEIVRVQGLATVQDLGASGFMDEALPRGGALVPELLVAANRSVGNADDACGIEVFGRATFRALHPVTVAIDDNAARLLAAGDTIAVESTTRRCAYLAVRGGLRGTPFRGRLRGTLLAANIGKQLTAAEKLVAEKMVSDTISVVPEKLVAAEMVSDTISVVPGPDLDAFADDALATLTAAPYRILPASNRVGTRLAGAKLPRRTDYRQRSYPMTIGAIEVPADGQPIVFGPEHPVTGGHPLIGVIRSADLGRFHAIPLGGIVRFATR